MFTNVYKHIYICYGKSRQPGECIYSIHFPVKVRTYCQKNYAHLPIRLGNVCIDRSRLVEVISLR